MPSLQLRPKPKKKIYVAGTLGVTARMVRDSESFLVLTNNDVMCIHNACNDFGAYSDLANSVIEDTSIDWHLFLPEEWKDEACS